MSSTLKGRTRLRIVCLACLLAIPLGLGAIWSLTTQAVHANTGSAGATSVAGCPPLLNHTFERLQDEKPQSLCQYQGLEDLYRRYRDQGLVVLGFPSGDFNQEKTDNRAIAEFCENTFGVQFPMFGISSVRGPNASLFYQQLAQQSGVTPRWNFYKYLVGRDGQVVAAYSSMTSPRDRRLVSAIQAQLARPAP